MSDISEMNYMTIVVNSKIIPSNDISDGSSFRYGRVSQQGEGVVDSVTNNVEVGSGGTLLSVLKANGVSIDKVGNKIDTNLKEIASKLESKIIKSTEFNSSFVDNFTKLQKVITDTQGKLETATKAQTTAIVNKDMKPTVNNSVSVDTTEISKATTEISKSNKILSDTALLQKEDIEFNKDGSSDLVDSDGQRIKPREVKAKNYHENAKYRKQDNEFDNEMAMNLLHDTLVPVSDEDSNYLENLLKDLLNLDDKQLDELDSKDLFSKFLGVENEI